MAEISIRTVLNDDRWSLVAPVLPDRRRRKTVTEQQVEPRAALAAVVYVVTTNLGWNDLPDDLFGIPGNTAHRWFLLWTDADLWRQLAAAAMGTPHARWARTVADAATARVSKH
jgi:transposase